MNINPDVIDILNIFINNGYEAFLVGGSIRNILLGKVPLDWDIATNAAPEEVMTIFPHSIPTGIKHGTVTVIFKDNSYEVTTYRVEGTYSNNRHPDSVRYVADIEEDLARRDFTVNAIAFNEKRGIVDPFNGQKDIENKIIRCVGEPDKRFNEDALRLLRAIRFSCVLKFSIEENTYSAILHNKELLKNISKERVRDELSKLLISDYPDYGIELLVATGLMEFIIPEISSLAKFTENDVYTHTIRVLKASPAKIEVRLAALLHEIGDSKSILAELRFSNKTISTVCKLITYHLSEFNFTDKFSIKNFINNIGKENIHLELDLMKAHCYGMNKPIDLSNVNILEHDIKMILEDNEPLSLKDLKIDGSDLVSIGFRQGKEIGNTLNELLILVLKDPSKNTKAQLLSIAKNMR